MLGTLIHHPRVSNNRYRQRNGADASRMDMKLRRSTPYHQNKFRELHAHVPTFTNTNKRWIGGTG